VFPLVVEAARGVQMSVGRPYFDQMAVPLGVALLLLMGVGPALPWGRTTPAQMRQALLPPLAGGVLVLLAGLAFGVRNPWTLATLLFGGYTAQVTLRELWLPVHQRMRAHGEGLLTAVREALFVRGRRRFGSYLVHAGVVIVVVAIAVSSTMGTHKEVVLRAGEATSLGPFTLTFVGAEQIQEPHRQVLQARVAVTRGDRDLGFLTPSMNQYDTQREPIGTPDVRSFLTGDLYVSILNIDPASGTVGLLTLINPMVGWIWAATGLMALGGLVTLVPWRRRQLAVKPASVEVAGGAAAERSR